MPRDRGPLGLVVPMPTLPGLVTKNSVEVAVAVEEPMANKTLLVSPALAWMEKRANDEVEPTPNWPVL